MSFNIHSVILVLALNFQLYDCLLWSASLPYLQNVWVNNSASIILSWQYQVTPTDNINSPNSMVVKCGYINGPDLIDLTTQQSDTGVMNLANQLNQFASRIEVVPFNNSRIVGFKINNVLKNDPNQFRCMAVADQFNAPPNSFYSLITTTQVLDPPSFVNCLNNVPAVVSNQDLQITCQVVGNPTPNLNCQLLSYTGSVLSSLGGFSQQNITQLSFKAVQPEASFITCTASNEKTGSAFRSVAIEVKHPPFAPRSFDVTPLTKTSLLLTWAKIPKNETGTELSYYNIEYYISRLGVLNKTTIRVQNDESSSPKMQYNLIGLATEQYTIVIYGVNSYGSGPPITKDAFPSDVTPETGSLKASKTGAIVGAVIGGVVAAIIIAVIIIWITKRSDKNKRYPMSYVEDAVDYPLNQDKSLYAGVDKKKKAASRKDSTSGYPDVVMGADDGQKTSYEMSSKVYV